MTLLNEIVAKIYSCGTVHRNAMGILNKASVVLKVFCSPKQRHTSMVIYKIYPNSVRVGLMCSD